MIFKFIIHPDSYSLAEYLTNNIRRKIKHNKTKNTTVACLSHASTIH